MATIAATSCRGEVDEAEVERKSTKRCVLFGCLLGAKEKRNHGLFPAGPIDGKDVYGWAAVVDGWSCRPQGFIQVTSVLGDEEDSPAIRSGLSSLYADASCCNLWSRVATAEVQGGYQSLIRLKIEDEGRHGDW